LAYRNIPVSTSSRFCTRFGRGRRQIHHRRGRHLRGLGQGPGRCDLAGL